MRTIYKPAGRAAEYSLLALNIYSGCSHGCKYCYVPRILHVDKDEFHTQAQPRPGLLEQLEKDARKYAGPDERVMLCFTCDPYQPIEKELGLTQGAIKILRKYDIPFQVLTKSHTAVYDFEMYGDDDLFAVTLTTLDDDEASFREPNADVPSKRIKALKAAHWLGIGTWVSLEPVLNPAETLEVIRRTHEFVDLYKIGPLNHHGHSDINWRRFGKDVIRLCVEFETPYYFKQDFTKLLHAVPYHNTDNRRVPGKAKQTQGRLFR